MVIKILKETVEPKIQESVPGVLKSIYFTEISLGNQVKHYQSCVFCHICTTILLSELEIESWAYKLALKSLLSSYYDKRDLAILKRLQGSSLLLHRSNIFQMIRGIAIANKFPDLLRLLVLVESKFTLKTWRDQK